MAQLSCGIIGLPNAGKSTLFNALTRAGAEVAAYPFCTIEPNVGVVPVKDPRLDRVAELARVNNVIYHTVEYVDVAGLVKDASKGAGHGNQFLENVRTCHALVHVVRCFEDPEVAHVEGALDPLDDVRTVNLELMLADLQTADRALDRLRKTSRHDPHDKESCDLLDYVRTELDGETPVRDMNLTAEQRVLLQDFRFLTAKAMLYVANIGESELPGDSVPAVSALSSKAGAHAASVLPLCATFEEAIAGMTPDEAGPFLEDAGLAESGLQRLVRATCDLLGLIIFMTFNEKEARAWTIPAGTCARDAAGEIHTDFADKFIRAEVTPYSDFDQAQGEKGAREQGLMKIEGREYVVRDGDVIYFRIAP